MFYSAPRKLPPIDYVSIVKSLYADRRSMLYGTLAAGFAAGLTWVRSGYLPLLVIAIAFAIAAIARYVDMKSFTHVDLAADDVKTASQWELRSTIGGAVVAGLHGLWCFLSFAAVDDGFASLTAASATMCGLVGIAMRNFALDRLVALQSLLVAVPLSVGLFLMGDIYHSLLAVLLLVFIISQRRLTGGMRQILLGAVHGRVEASRLAREFDTALSTMPHGLCMLDAEGRVTVVNAQAQTLFPGLAHHRSIGRPLGQVVLEARRDGLLTEALAKQLTRALAVGRKPRKFIVPLPQKRQCEITVTSRDGHTVLMFDDVTERIAANERINFMARFDGLTSLPNRSHFSEVVETELLRNRALRPRRQVMMMMVDIDDFKHVNDTFGHLVGDALLVEAACRIRKLVEPFGLVARFGGDEFTVFRANGISRRRVERDAVAILDSLRQPYHVMGHTLRANASVGFVIAASSEDVTTILTRADLALYKAKGNGKGQWAMFHKVMDTDYRQRQRLKTDLREAIGSDEMTLVYQPIVDIHTRRIVGCEALTRWRHKELGQISPAVFIPIAEETGLISDLSRWVLSTATRECMHWPQALRISVNLSATDFRTNDVADMVKQSLVASGLPPSRLEIEITESTLIEEKAAVVGALSALRLDGVGIALDDFGTGYSSLSYLHALPFTKLKIDRSFVGDVATNPRSLKLMANIARLSQDLAMTVTVEGIETEEQLTAIASCKDVDQAQGYLFGVPLPGREVADLIARMAGPSTLARRKTLA